MKFLVDTHLLIWSLTGNARLSEKVREILVNPENDCYFSAISVWEVAIKHMSRPDKIEFSGVKFAQLCRDAGFSPLDLSDKYAAALETLRRSAAALETLRRSDDAPPHKDPFDRMLIAQAKSEGMALLTHDSLLTGYQEDCVIFV